MIIMTTIVTLIKQQRNYIEGPNQREEKKSHCSANKKPLNE